MPDNKHFTPEMRRIDVGAAVLNFLGVSVSVSRNDDDGQLTVMILTEDVRGYDTYDHEHPDRPGGMPKIYVSLNDGEIYDDEGQGDKVARQHIEKAAREADINSDEGTA